MNKSNRTAAFSDLDRLRFVADATFFIPIILLCIGFGTPDDFLLPKLLAFVAGYGFIYWLHRHLSVWFFLAYIADSFLYAVVLGTLAFLVTSFSNEIFNYASVYRYMQLVITVMPFGSLSVITFVQYAIFLKRMLQHLAHTGARIDPVYY